MKQLDFSPEKSTGEFRKNYKLHDLAELYGKNLLIQWGFTFEEFGKDKRFEKVWEGGQDKPDLIIEYKGKKALLDWKGKHKAAWLTNKRAASSYEKWQEKFNIPAFICFAVFTSHNSLSDFRFACLGFHNYIFSTGKEWDKNDTIEFNSGLPEFTKANILKHLRM